MICRGPGCTNTAIANGLCDAHRKQLKRNGYLKPLRTVSESPETRFFNSIDLQDLVEDLGPCWIWTGKEEKGYPIFYVGRQRMRAHRWSYEHHKGVSLRAEQTLDHLCRQPLCTNPDHLTVVSRIENIERKNLYYDLVRENERLRKELEE